MRLLYHNRAQKANRESLDISDIMVHSGQPRLFRHLYLIYSYGAKRTFKTWGIVDISMNLFIAKYLYLFVDKSINLYVDLSIFDPRSIKYVQKRVYSVPK